MLIDKLVKDCCDETLEFKVEDIKPRTYYVVEIKYNKQNVIHRCIMVTGFDCKDKLCMHVELYSKNYEYIIRTHITDIYYFKIISEIKDMDKLI